MKQVKDLSNSYILVQNDEVEEIQEQYCGIKKENFFQYLFVKLDKSKADYAEIYGCDSCNLDASVFRIYTNNFNRKKSN